MEDVKINLIGRADSDVRKSDKAHLEEMQASVDKIEKVKPVHRIKVQNGIVLTTRPEYWAQMYKEGLR